MRPEGTKIPIVIGVTGGVGAGKSRVLKILEERHHAQVLLADQVAAELEEPGQEGLVLLTKEFGNGILGEDGRLDRTHLPRRFLKIQKFLPKSMPYFILSPGRRFREKSIGFPRRQKWT